MIKIAAEVKKLCEENGITPEEALKQLREHYKER